MSALAMGRLSDRKGPVGRGSLLAMKLAPRHYFYDRCNEILAEAEFDETVEMLCQPYYEDDGRLSVPPGRSGATHEMGRRDLTVWRPCRFFLRQRREDGDVGGE